ncbi:MAG: T9SS type A sorting domain-containing protein [Aureispira sp.]|nr:T9SS type A sorting domain-containing protein [Aureispira sp.]
MINRILFLCFSITISTSLLGQTFMQEDFNSGIPVTWTVISGGNTGGIHTWAGTVGGLGANYLDGTEFAIVNSDAAGSGVVMSEILNSPVINTNTVSGFLYLDFEYYYRTLTGVDSAIVQVYDGSVWQNVAVYTGTSSGNFVNPIQEQIDITAHSNANLAIRFYYTNASFEYYWCVDNVHVYAVACPDPSVLTVDSITATTTNLNWVETGTASQWQIEYDTTGFATGTGNLIISNNQSTTLTGLLPNTEYDYYVRSICSATDSSNWIGPISFLTDCNTVSAPFIEHFENSNFWDCWRMGSNSSNFVWEEGTGITPSLNTGPNGASIPAAANDLGYVYTEATLALGGDVTTLISPRVDLSSLVNPELSFEYHMYGADMGDLYIEVETGGVWTVVDSIKGQQQTGGNDAWLVKKIDLSAFSGTAIRVGFVGVRGNGNTSDIAIDDVLIDNPRNAASLAFVDLEQSYCHVDSIEAKFIIKNMMNTAVADIPYNIKLDGAIVANGLLPNLAANSQDTVSFGPIAVAKGLHSLDAITKLFGDTSLVDDIISQQITVSNTTTIIVGSAPVACNGESNGSASTTASQGLGAYSYQWEAAAGGYTTQTATGLAAGDYDVVATDTAGCADTATVTIMEPSVLLANAIDNGNGTATASGVGGTSSTGYSYIWNTGGQTTNTATWLISGNTYCVTISDDNNCEDTACVYIIMTGVDDLESARALKIYPNPVSQNASIQIEHPNLNVQYIYIINSLGETVIAQQISNSAQITTLTTQKLDKGYYFIHILTKEWHLIRPIIITD